MAISRSQFSKCFIFLVFSIHFCHVELKASDAASQFTLNFEQIKNDLFSLNQFNVLDLMMLKKEDSQCFKELNAIKNGLQNTEIWAMKSKSRFDAEFLEIVQENMNFVIC